MLKFWFCFHTRTLLCNGLFRRRLRVVPSFLREGPVFRFLLRERFLFHSRNKTNMMSFLRRRLMHLLRSAWSFGFFSAFPPVFGYLLKMLKLKPNLTSKVLKISFKERLILPVVFLTNLTKRWRPCLGNKEPSTFSLMDNRSLTKASSFPINLSVFRNHVRQMLGSRPGLRLFPAPAELTM